MWSAWQAGDRKGALAAIPDEVVDALVVHGSFDECRAHVGRYVANGVDIPVMAVIPLGRPAGGGGRRPGPSVDGGPATPASGRSRRAQSTQARGSGRRSRRPGPCTWSASSWPNRSSSPPGGVGQGHDPHRQQGGVAGTVDGHRRHRDAFRHLDHGQQRVESAQIGQGHRDPDHRQGRGCGHHAGQVGGSPGGAMITLTPSSAAPRAKAMVSSGVRWAESTRTSTPHPERAEGLDGIVHDRRVG